MERPMSAVGFRLMSLGLKIRDTVRPRMGVLREVGIKPGDKVLDFGCGPGGYLVPLAQLVGTTGQIYALDMTPPALTATRRLASRRGIDNVRTIASDGDTGLPDESVDAVLLYDTLHHLSRRDEVLGELRRVLKGDGVLSVSDHHLKEDVIVGEVTGAGMFELARKGELTYSFVKTGAREVSRP